MVVVVAHINAQYLLKLMAGEDQDPVKAFLTQCSDPTFGDGVRVGCQHRRSYDVDAVGPEDGIEASGELGVPVSHEEPNPTRPLGERHREVAGLLSYPGLIRVRGRAGEVHDA
jgi:hypothetical protein